MEQPLATFINANSVGACNTALLLLSPVLRFHQLGLFDNYSVFAAEEVAFII